MTKRKRPADPVVPPTTIEVALPRAAPHEVRVDRAIVVIALFVVFARSIPYQIVRSWDDGRFLIDSPVIHPSFASLVSIFTEPHFQAYHPLHLLSYWIDVPWFGPVGWAVHTTNLVLFSGAAMLMLAWLRELGLPRWPALFATLAFVLHPVQVEVLVWATARKDVLAVLFSLGAWLAHLRAKDLWDRTAWISRLLFLCACLSKTSAVCLPIAMFAVDVCTQRRTPRDAALRQAPAIAAALALGLVTISIWSSNDMIRPEGRSETAPGLVLATLSHAVTTAVWPASTSPLYELYEDVPTSAAWLALGVALVGAIAFLAYRHREEAWGRWLGGGVAAFGALLLPVSNLLPNYFELADRYLSLPFVGLTLALAAGFSLVKTPTTKSDAPSGSLVLLAALVIVPLALRTVQYEGVWSSELRLWSHATATHPRSFFAWVKLAEARRDVGRLDGSIDAYVSATQIQPTAVLAHAGLLMTLVQRDERDEGLPPPSRSEEIATLYRQHRNDADALRTDSAELLREGYRMSMLFFLGRSLDLEPVSEERLERAAQIQLAQDHEWVARFYVSRMTRRPILPTVAQFYDEERERLGIPPLERPDEDDHLPLQVPLRTSP